MGGVKRVGREVTRRNGTALARPRQHSHLYPSALFFVCIGVYASNNDVFAVGETMVIGIVGYILLRLDFHPAPVLLGLVLGPRFEENFRRAMMISDGDFSTFITSPISAFFLAVCVLLLVVQLLVRNRASRTGEIGLPSSNPSCRSDNAGVQS
jgi:TctA family transporter